MNSNDLTVVINNTIRQLKGKIDDLPSGGGFESLRIRLDDIQKSIKGFISQLDELEQDKIDPKSLQHKVIRQENSIPTKRNNRIKPKKEPSLQDKILYGLNKKPKQKEFKNECT